MRKQILLALLGLGFITAAAAAATADEPDWLKQARAREGVLGAPKKIKASDGFFQARVPAKLTGKIVPDQDTYLVRMEIKTGAPVECVVMRQAADLASFLVATSQNTYEAIEAARGKIAAKAVERVDAGAIGASPFLAVDWAHRIEPEGQPAVVGALKQLAASKDGHTIYCAHDEVGYHQTFRRLAEALVESLAFADTPRTKPYRTEVSTITLQGMRVAVDHLTYRRDEDGDTKIEHTTAMLVPVDGRSLMASDEVMVQWVRPDGSLINAFQAENENGEVGTQLKLEPHEDGGWAVSGTFQSKTLTAKFPSAKPSTMLGDVLALRAKLAEPNPVGGRMSVQSWLPSVDPAKLLEQKLEIMRALDDDRFAAKLEMGGIVADLVVTRDGSTVSGTLSIGPTKLEIERVFADGAI